MQAQVFQKPFMVQHTVTTAEGTADSATIQILPDEMIGVNTTDGLIFILAGRTSAGLQLTGLTAVYSRTTGILTVTGTLTAADVLTVVCQFGVIS